MTEDTTDFVFGSTIVDSINGKRAFRMRDAEKLAQTASQRYFTHQLNRAINEYGTNGRVYFTDSATKPNFAPILLQLNDDDVGLIKIRLQNKEAPNGHVPLCCEVYLDNGVAVFAGGWSPYRRDRILEVMETLISPLCYTRLLRKTYIGDSSSPSYLKDTPENLVKEILELAEFAYPLDLEDSDQEYIQQHIGTALTFDAQQHKAELAGSKQERFRKLLGDAYKKAESN